MFTNSGGKKKSGGGSVTPKATPPVLTPSSAKKRGSKVSKLAGSFAVVRYILLGVKVRNLKVEFVTGGTWRQVGQ